MKLICAIVKPFKVPELVDAFSRAGPFPGMTVVECRGFGREKTVATSPSRRETDEDFTDHQLVLIAAPAAAVASIVERLMSVAHTGQPGDGKLFVLPMEEAIALTTRERGEGALR